MPDNNASSIMMNILHKINVCSEIIVADWHNFWRLSYDNIGKYWGTLSSIGWFFQAFIVCWYWQDLYQKSVCDTLMCTTLQPYLPLHKKMNFSIKDFFSSVTKFTTADLIWSHLLEKFLIENFIHCAVCVSCIPVMLFLICPRLNL